MCYSTDDKGQGKEGKEGSENRVCRVTLFFWTGLRDEREQ